MEEKEKKEIAVNVSSGAEKVERVEAKVKNGKTETTKKVVEKKTEKAPNVKKMNAKSTDGKAEKESRKAKERVEKALKKKEEKENRKRLRKERFEKMKAERKAKAEARRARRKARMEEFSKKREERRREKAHAKANKNKERSQTRQKRQKERSERGERKRGKSYGGWLAAVIALGTITLALGTVVTVGAVEMTKERQGMMSGHRATTYELVGVMENVDDDLDRIRVSASPVSQSRILTDVLVQARVAESNLEKLPVEMLSDRNLTAFINRVGSESERMLSKLRNGEKLSKEDKEQLEKLYQTSHAVRAELSEYVANMNEKDMMQFMKKGEGVIRDVLDRIENATLPENGDVKEGIDSEIAQNNPVKNTQKIGTAKAEELCKTYFSDYGMDSFQCIGETVGENYARYNVQGHDKEGTMLFAEIDERTGSLVGFNYYKECNERRFDHENAVDLAEEFLEKLGYEDMTAVRIRENGTDADITFVYEEDDVFIYPDSVKVKVCLSRGIVSGMDATSYIKNHRKRDLEKAKISLSTAREKLNENLDVLGARTALVNTVKGEKMAYEFLCSYGEEKYVVYINAQTGDEISIVNLKNIK